jgi:Mitochondrial carrier protein
MLSRRQKALADAVAGVAAALVAQLVTYPLDVHKTRCQASSSHHHNNSDDCDDDEEEEETGDDEVGDADADEGERRYRAPSPTSSTPPMASSSSSSPSKRIVNNFAGWKVKVLHTSASTFCYFYLYSFLLSLHRARTGRRRKGQPVGPRKVSNAAHLLLSAAAAMLNTLLTLPLDVISSRQQVLSQSCDDGRVAAALSPGRQRRSLPSLSNISELWRGLVPSLMLCANPAINYTVYDALKDRVLRHRQQQQSPRGKPQLSALQAFGLGIIAKFVATLVTYPLIRAKVLLMVGSTTSSHTNDDDDAGNAPPSSSSSSSSVATLLHCLSDDYRQNGIRGGWYRGCSLQLVHTLLKSAMLMAIKEQITGSVREAVAMMMMTTTNAASAAGSTRRPASDQQ